MHATFLAHFILSDLTFLIFRQVHKGCVERVKKVKKNKGIPVIVHRIPEACDSVVVKVLCYKLERRRFESL
jgi:hypothetical protein